MARPPQNDQEVRAGEVAKRLPGITNPTGAEVGVFAGDMSECLLDRMPGLVLYMIDPWKEIDPDSLYAISQDPHSRCTQVEHDEYQTEARRRVERFGDRARVRVATSTEAALEFPNACLDFVFLDADHTFEAVRSDLISWASKVKPEGYLCGHDFANGTYTGVAQAVREFACGRSIDLGADFTWFLKL